MAARLTNMPEKHNLVDFFLIVLVLAFCVTWFAVTHWIACWRGGAWR